MILVRPTINFYYDNIVNGVPVPNGILKYKINKKYFNIPVMSSLERNDQVVKTTYFYNVMKVYNVNVNLYTNGETVTNLFYPLELSKFSKSLITDIIPRKTLDRVKKKKLKILILYQQWIGDYKLMSTLKDRIDVLIRHGVPAEQIYVITGDVNCSYQELFGKIKVFGIDWWQIAYQLRYKTKYQEDDYHWVSFLADDVKLHVNDISKDLIDINEWKEPSFLFSIFAGKPSQQSIALLSELKVKGLIDKGIYEFNTENSKGVNLNSKILFDIKAGEEYIKLKKQAINELISEIKHIPDIKTALEKSLISIIVEPFVPKLDKNYLSETRAMWISPQVWKFIALGHPFIVLGSLSVMRYLNNEGYFSYVDLLNEKYDSISSLPIKVQEIAKEIARISSIPKDEITEKINLTKPFIIANRKKFFEKNHAWKFYDLFTEMRYE